MVLAAQPEGELAADEIRLSACGTGMPAARHGQAATCWLVELGNGDKFLFDIGTGSSERISAMKIPYDYLDKVFIGHLHADHFGDLDALWIGGWLSGRYTPLHIYGPSGSKPELGTAAFVEGLKKTYAWDVSGRAGILPDAGGPAAQFVFTGPDGSVVPAERADAK